MPRKERDQRPTRSDQMPDALGALDRPRSDFDAEAGEWAIDEQVARLRERGIFSYPAPPKSVRQLVRIACLNADRAARSIYRYRDNKAERDRERKTLVKAQNALEALSDFSADLHIEPRHALVLQEAISERLSTLEAHPPAMTGDRFAREFVSEILRVWHLITSVSIDRPNGAIFRDFLTAAWVDGKCPGWNDDRSQLHARLSKRADQISKVARKIDRGN